MRSLATLSFAAVIGLISGTAHAQVTVDQYFDQACLVNPNACKTGERIRKEMMRCVQMPSPIPDRYKMMVRLMLENGEMTFLSVSPDALQLTPWEQQTAEAIGDAVVKCQPYSELSGPFVFLITPDLLTRAPTP